MGSSDVRMAFDRLAELAKIVYAKEKYWHASEITFLSPAAEPEIQELSDTRPFPLPASYLDFLRVWNGCLNFWPQFALMGSQGEPRRIVEAAVADARQHQAQFVSGVDGVVTPESIIAFEAPTEGRQLLYLPNHTVFGTDQGGEFFVFNECQSSSDGEYEVIHYTYSGGAYYRYPDFLQFLQARTLVLETRIKQKKYAK
jgi:hypothetical protein